MLFAERIALKKIIVPGPIKEGLLPFVDCLHSPWSNFPVRMFKPAVTMVNLNQKLISMLQAKALSDCIASFTSSTSYSSRAAWFLHWRSEGHIAGALREESRDTWEGYDKQSRIVLRSTSSAEVIFLEASTGWDQNHGSPGPKLRCQDHVNTFDSWSKVLILM